MVLDGGKCGAIYVDRLLSLLKLSELCRFYTQDGWNRRDILTKLGGITFWKPPLRPVREWYVEMCLGRYVARKRDWWNWFRIVSSGCVQKWRLACSLSVHVFHLSLDLFPCFSVPDDSYLVTSDVALLSFNFPLLNTIVGNRDTIFHLTSYSSVLSVQPRMIHFFYVTRGKIVMPYWQAICLSRLYTFDLHEIFIVSLYVCIYIYIYIYIYITH